MSKTVLCKCGARVRVVVGRTAGRSVQCPACGKLVAVRKRRSGGSARSMPRQDSPGSAKSVARARSERVRRSRPSQAPLFVGAGVVAVLLVVAIVYMVRSGRRATAARGADVVSAGDGVAVWTGEAAVASGGGGRASRVHRPVRARYSDASVRRLVHTLHAGKLKARTRAAEALGAMGPRACEAVPDLLVAMGRKSAGIEFEMAVARAFRAMGAAALPEVLDALKSRSSKTRFYAALALTKMGPRARGAVDALVGVLEQDADLSVRASAAAALGAIGPAAAKAVPALRRAAGNPNAAITHDTARGELRVRAQMAIDQIQSRIVK